MTSSTWNMDLSAFSAHRMDEIVTLKFSSNPMFHLTDLHAKEALFQYLGRIADHSEIKAVILFSNPEKRGREEYLDFYDRLLKKQITRDALLRMYNAVNQLIIKILELNKVTIHANSGKVIMMFLNISMASDYRIIADNTVFQNPCHELGMIPKGGGAYFLSKRLGQAKAFEILMSCRNIQAEEALTLGLINEVVPLDKLEDAALEAAYRYSRNPARSLEGVKRLLNYCMRDIRDYLKFENDEIMRIVDSGILKK